MKLDAVAQRRFALEVLERLRTAGFLAYWAGGCVRDELLGRTPKDYDVATNARPPEIRELFGMRRTLAVGEAFGVIVVVGPKPAGTVEVTTFRRDAAYADGRRPDSVTFTDAEEDARRRDFTINALFYDPEQKRVIDYVGGRDDLERRVVRAVGEARLRFEEDKLRMLRAVRMAATFGFALDAGTFAALRASAHEVTVVSPERIAQELRGMLGKPGQAEAARLLMTTGLAEAVVPEVMPLVARPHPAQGNAWNYVVGALEHAARSDENSFGLALAILLHATETIERGAVAAKGEATVGGGGEAGAESAAEVAVECARRWRLSNEERDQAAWLVRHQGALDGAAARPWSAVQPMIAHAWGENLIGLHESLAAAAKIPWDDASFCRAKRALPAEVLDPPPLVTGHDLKDAGLKPGREFARLLQTARDAQLDGRVATREEALDLIRRSLEG